MRIKVLFFGQLKDVTGLAEDVADVPPGATLGSVFEFYADRFPALGKHRSSTVMAHNQRFAGSWTALAEGDEVAFLPPVSGGSGPTYTHELADPDGCFFALTRNPIDLQSLRDRLLAGSDGAVVLFEGVVRNNTRGRATKHLDYEGYEPMAVETMRRLGREIAASHAIGRIAMVHRLGRLQIGEASVVVAVTAPHRKAAFDAALEGINRLKKTVPIWKKEYFEDGEVWVEGEWDPSLPGR